MVCDKCGKEFQSKIAEKVYIHDLDRTYFFCDDCFSKLLDWINTDNGWISVKDRLPDDKELYLICNESNFEKINIAYYQPIGDKFSNYEPFWQGRSSRSTCVTHWMPLPEPPKESNND